MLGTISTFSKILPELSYATNKTLFKSYDPASSKSGLSKSINAFIHAILSSALSLPLTTTSDFDNATVFTFNFSSNLS